MARGSWEVEFHPACEVWADDLPQADAEALLAAIRVLRAEGPNLGRPLVDRIQGSRHANMKELCPGSTGRTEVRVLFAFDRRRGGDPAGARRQERGLEGLVQGERPDRQRPIR